MALSYTAVDIRGVAFKDILGEILFDNRTVSDGYVTFADEVKANTVFTDTAHTIALQAYTSGQPTGSGTIGVVDTIVTPTKLLAYDTFNMEALRTGRFNRDMKPGAWSMTSSEFEATVLNGISPYISQAAESLFWNAAKTATKTAVAALTAGTAQTSVGAAEKTYVAAAPTGLIDGIVTKLIYNNAAVGKRVKVAGTTIDSSNIFTEYGKLYTGVPAQVLHSKIEVPFIYAPYTHLALINQFNTANTYKSDVFVVDMNTGKYIFQGIEIKFVPLPENTMVVACKSSLVWATDLTDDLNYLEINKVYNNADDMFYKAVFLIENHVRNQKFITLYVG
jgi:hypothetical protein